MTWRATSVSSYKKVACDTLKAEEAVASAAMAVKRKAEADVEAKRAEKRQGLTLVHFSAQRKHFVWDRGCI